MGTGQKVKLHKCQPFEPIRKAIGSIVGINSFQSPSQQLSCLKSATDFADSFNSLSFLFSIEGKGSDDSHGVDDETGNDIYVLADSIAKILSKKAQQTYDQLSKKLVIIFEDMEYSDKTSLDLIRALVKTFAKDFRSNPIIFVICY